MSRYPRNGQIAAQPGIDNTHNQYAGATTASGRLETGEASRNSTQTACTTGGKITAVIGLTNRGNGEALGGRPVRVKASSLTTRPERAERSDRSIICFIAARFAGTCN